MSPLKAKILKTIGAKVIWCRTLPEQHPDSYMNMATRLSKEIPNSFVLDQFNNPANPRIHYTETANEILEQCDGKLDYFVVGPGTGGTLTGIGARFREILKNVKIIGADPIGSLLAEPMELNVGGIAPYLLEGSGHQITPKMMDKSLVDVWQKNGDLDSFKMTMKII